MIEIFNVFMYMKMWGVNVLIFLTVLILKKKMITFNDWVAYDFA